MKLIRVRLIAPTFLLVGAALSPAITWSMDVLTDGQLATTTGQDGLSVLISLPNNTLKVDQVALFGGNGFTGQANAGALVFGKNANGLAATAAPSLGNGISLTMNNPLAIVMDSSGASSKPTLNLAIYLPTILTLVTGDLGIAAATGIAGNYKVSTGTLGNANTGVIRIMDSTSLTVNLSGTPQITLQLGNQNQGSLINLTSLNISSVVFNTPVSLASPNGGSGSSSLSFTPSITGLNLTGATIDIASATKMNALGFTNSDGTAVTAGGVVFQCANLSAQGCSIASPTTGVNFALNNVTAGQDGSSNSNFGGMKNASMGSFGVTGMTVTNLKIGVSGM